MLSSVPELKRSSLPPNPLRNATIDDSDPSLEFSSGWLRTSSSGTSGGTFSFASGLGDSVEVSLPANATSIYYLGWRQSSPATYGACVDCFGGSTGLLDTIDAHAGWDGTEGSPVVLWALKGLDPTVLHTVTLINLPEPDQTTASIITLDGFITTIFNPEEASLPSPSDVPTVSLTGILSSSSSSAARSSVSLSSSRSVPSSSSSSQPSTARTMSTGLSSASGFDLPLPTPTLNVDPSNSQGSPSASSSSSTSGLPPSNLNASSGPHLSSGVMAAIIVPILLTFAILAAALAYIHRRRRSNNQFAQVQYLASSPGMREEHSDRSPLYSARTMRTFGSSQMHAPPLYPHTPPPISPYFFTGAPSPNLNRPLPPPPVMQARRDASQWDLV